MASVVEAWFRLPQFVRFNLSGLIGTLLFQQLNSAIYHGLADFEHGYKSAAVFGFSYFISCLWQHALHRYLVFGCAGSAYITSLLAFYATYSLSVAASPVVNGALTVGMGLGMDAAYWLSLAIIGVMNYFTAGKVMGGREGQPESQKASCE